MTAARLSLAVAQRMNWNRNTVGSFLNVVEKVATENIFSDTHLGIFSTLMRVAIK